MDLIFQEKIPNNVDAFKAKVADVAARLDINPNWLMAVMNSETAGTFSPSIQNPTTNATGLIQFMPATARGLGTSVDALKAMSNVDQMEYVYQYFRPYKNYITKYEDLYIITFYPNADGKFAGTLSKPDDWLFPNPVYAANRGIDLNKDGQLTMFEFRRWVFNKIPQSVLSEFFKSQDAVKKFAARNATIIVLLIVASAAIGFGFYNYTLKA